MQPAWSSARQQRPRLGQEATDLPSCEAFAFFNGRQLRRRGGQALPLASEWQKPRPVKRPGSYHAAACAGVRELLPASDSLDPGHSVSELAIRSSKGGIASRFRRQLWWLCSGLHRSESAARITKQSKRPLPRANHGRAATLISWGCFYFFSWSLSRRCIAWRCRAKTSESMSATPLLQMLCRPGSASRLCCSSRKNDAM